MKTPKEILKPILVKMCSYVEANCDNIDWKNDNNPFFLKYEWTREQENDFIEWLADYLIKNKEAREMIMQFPSKNEKIIKKTAEAFVFQYGWKTKIDKNDNSNIRKS